MSSVREARERVAKAQKREQEAARAANPSVNGHEANGKVGDQKKEGGKCGIPIPWDPMVALDDIRPPAEPFPLHCLPPRVEAFVRGISESMHTAPDYAAAACLSVAAASIGATARLRMKGKWTEQPCLWIGLVGSSGELKSPSAKHAMEPYDSEHAKRIEVKRERDRERSRSRRTARAVGADGQPDDVSATPYARDEGELKTSNATVEGLIRILKRQRRGILFHSDELLGWLNGMDQYKPGGKGNDRQTFLSLYDGGRIDMTRAGESHYLSGCCMNILGTIQPRMMSGLFRDPDGLAARFLWVYPEASRAVEEDWRVPDEHLYGEWEAIVQTLLSREMVPDEIGSSVLHPEWFTLDYAGRSEWEEFSKYYAEQYNDSPDGSVYHSFAAKLRGIGARLAITLRVLWEAAGPSVRDRGLVNGEDVGRATVLCRYFASMAHRVYAAGGGDPRHEGARAILEWIRRHKDDHRTNEHGFKEFSRAELWQSLRHGPHGQFVRPEDLHPPIALLNACHIVRWVDRSYYGGPGRKPTPVWEVNPKVFEEGTAS